MTKLSDRYSPTSEQKDELIQMLFELVLLMFSSRLSWTVAWRLRSFGASSGGDVAAYRINGTNYRRDRNQSANR